MNVNVNTARDRQVHGTVTALSEYTRLTWPHTRHGAGSNSAGSFSHETLATFRRMCTRRVQVQVQDLHVSWTTTTTTTTTTSLKGSCELAAASTRMCYKLVGARLSPAPVDDQRSATVHVLVHAQGRDPPCRRKSNDSRRLSHCAAPRSASTNRLCAARYPRCAPATSTTPSRGDVPSGSTASAPPDMSMTP